jgi:flagellar biosynthesis/type III secretory pathway M-ring protein FliF/YscJ
MSAVLAAAPALPLHSAGKYVAGAYVVFLVLVLIYVAIMATRLSRTERDLVELHQELQAREDARAREQEHETEPVG